MSAAREHEASIPSKMSAEGFLDMIRDRPNEERWQLIDGEPLRTTNPPAGKHQRIAANLERLLNVALGKMHPELDAIREIGLAVEQHPDFRVIADLAVLPFELGDEQFFTGFRLVAEVLSPSNTAQEISRKRLLYGDEPDCLFVLILRQDEPCVEVWSRARGWQGRVFRSMDDRIELTEFGFSCRLGELYRGTPLR